MQSAERFADAYEILQAIESDTEASLLGPGTALGLPRRLHSAYLRLAKAENDTVRRAGLQFHLVPPTTILKPFTQFTTIERKQINEINRQPVTRKIHQIWIGDKPVPAAAKAWEEHARAQGYEYQLWRENALLDLGLERNAAYLDMLSKEDLPGVVDVARYQILENQGGIYLDCDWYPARNDLSFHDLLPMMGLTTLPEDVPRNTGKGCTLFANSFIAAPPHHPVFTRILSCVGEITRQLPKAPAWWATGPLLFTLMARGGSVTLADADFVAGALPPQTRLADVERWCRLPENSDNGLMLAWREWAR